MRLVLVVPRFPRLSETFIVSQFLGLVDAGWDVHVVCGQTEPWDAFPRLLARPELRRRVHRAWPTEPRRRAALLWLPALLLTLLRAPLGTLRYLWSARGAAVAQAAREFYLDAALIALSPDIIHFEFGALAAGRTHLKHRLGCRLAVSFRGYDLSFVGLDDPNHYAVVWRDADAIHTLGRDLWQRALRRGCPPDKPHALIPPAVDTATFRPADDAASPAPLPPRSPAPLRILSVGRLEWKKGYEYGLEAAQLLKARGVPFTYRILGGGSYLEPLAFARHRLGLEDEVEFLGPRPQAEVLAQMRWADVLLHPAVSEGFGNAVLEAQAMALPVVCSDADGLAENVADGLTGFVVPRRAPEALAAALARLAGDPALRRRMGAAGRERTRTCFPLAGQNAAFDRFFRDVAQAAARVGYPRGGEEGRVSNPPYSNGEDHAR
jgi:colanic acid/amylovoran biosynthesis glycosyltransferase